MPTHERAGTSNHLTPLYIEAINILDELANKEVDRYLTENPKIIPLFEVDVVHSVTPYVIN